VTPVALRDLLARPAPHAEVSALRNELTAVLRWRLRWLRTVVPERALRAARLVPVLLHASFERPRLEDDAPGVSGLRYRRSWSSLARSFELPPPCRAQRAAPLVEAILTIPAATGLEVLVLVAPSLRADDRRWVGERAAAAQEHLAAQRAPLELRVLDPSSLTEDPAAAHGALAFGALVGGRLSAGAWAALEAAARWPVGPAVMAALAIAAPTPLAALALTLLSSRPAAAPLDVAAALLRKRQPARAVADASVLAVRWAAAGRIPQYAELERTLELARAHRPRPAPPPRVPGTLAPAPAVARPSAGEVLDLGHTLGLAAARAIHGARRHGIGPAARRAWREAVGTDLPRALVPALHAALSGAGGFRSELVRSGPAHEVRLPDGAVLGRGGTPVQARVRALSLLATAALDPLVEHAEAPWRSLAPRLAQRREKASRVLVVEPAAPSGPPFDPLNRGPSRAVGFAGALEVRLAPGRRPSARVLTGEQAVDRLVRAAAQREATEVVPARSEAHPVAARLAQVAGLVREARGEVPVALEAGGRVLVPAHGSLRSYALARFAARPRAYTADPDAPDLALSPGERRRLAIGGAHTVECRAHLLDELRAAVLYADGARGQLREVVFLSELEEHLRESRAILQAAHAGAILAVRLSDDLEPAIRRMGAAGAPVPVAVRGRLPFDLQVEVRGERYGGSSGRSWSAAAVALLEAWPRGGEARISVSAVTISSQGHRAGGLLALYARAAVVRRLRIHLVRALRSYRRPETVRKGR
jgi:hypothetical protein